MDQLSTEGKAKDKQKMTFSNLCRSWRISNNKEVIFDSIFAGNIDLSINANLKV